MPGSFGFFYRRGNKLPENLADGMQSQLEHGEKWFEGKLFHNQFGFHGVVDFKSRLENDYASSNGKSIVIYGNIYSSEDSRISSQNKAKMVLFLYEKGGLDFLKHLNGSFVLSIYDEEDGKLVIANDRYGSKNLFYLIKSNEILYSSEIKAILADTSIKPNLNSEAIAEFFTFSYLLGNKTFFEGIELLSPASILIQDYKGDKVQIKTYWDFEFNRDKEPKALETYIEEFDYLMEKAVKARMEDKDKIGIFLSGGLDSRLIAAFAKRIADHTNKELISFTFGTRGGWQEKIAKQVAEELKIENRFYEISSDSIARYAEEVVYKGDGHIRIRDVHFISELDKVKKEVDTVLVGFFCDTVFGAHLHKDMLQLSNRDELAYFLFRKYKVKQIAEHIPWILSESFQDNPEEKARRNFIETVKEISFNNYEEIEHYQDLRQRGRRYMLNLSNQVNWYLNSADPYLDNEVVNFAINLPLELKIKKIFIHKVLKYLFPNLAKIPYEGTGVLPDTTGLPLLFSRGERFAQRQLKTLIEKASSGKILFKPKDYRAYDYWLRTGSIKYVGEVLLQERKEDIFNRGYVWKILKEHMHCKRNHGQLICDMLNIQLLLDKYNLCDKNRQSRGASNEI